jgi:hypothetical protein
MVFGVDYSSETENIWEESAKENICILQKETAERIAFSSRKLHNIAVFWKVRQYTGRRNDISERS